MKKNIYCRKLDKQAEVFTLVSNSKYCSVFRFTVVLKEKINEEKLLTSYVLTLEKYKALKVRLKGKLFDYVLEENNSNPLVFKVEKEPNFSKINTKDNNEYLIKVCFSNNIIWFDFYHALTDGTTGMLFVKECISRYLELCYEDKLEKIYVNDTKKYIDSKDAYLENCKDFKKISYPFLEGYRITGNTIKNNIIQMNHFEINVNLLKSKAKEFECTLSMYIAALIGFTIYEISKKDKNVNKKPINLCIPISLNKYFETDTLSNFFSHMFITIDLKNNKEYTFEDIVKEVKKQFEEKIKLEKIMGVIAGNVSKMNNIILKCIPLKIKKGAFVLGSLKLKKQFTMTVSNIGKIEFEDRFYEFIENSYVTLACDWAEKVKCGISSYKENITITFCKNIEETIFEDGLKNNLDKLNIKYKLF